MANRERGEMRLVVGEQTYTLCLTTNAACDVEDRSGKTLDELRRDILRGSVSALRWLLWAALQDRHGDTVKTAPHVGRLIDAAGGLTALIDQMLAFLALNAPPEGAAAAAGSGNGTGPPPSRPPDAQSETSGAVS